MADRSHDTTSNRDVIIGNVGKNARKVIVGKNIIQIGRIIVPIWLAYTVCAILLVILALILYPLVKPIFVTERMPEGHYNIAVAEFRLLGSDNSSENRDLARQLSKSVAGFIKSQHMMLGEVVSHPVTVWGDEQAVNVIGPRDDLEQRLKALNATVLLYGTIEHKKGNEWEISPRFYLEGEVVQLAEELIGEHALGTPILIEFGNPSSSGRANREMRARTRALILILMGLWDYRTGHEDDYLSAAHRFEEAASDPEWGAAAQKKGQEVLYLFLGNAYLKLASLVTSPDSYSQYIEVSKRAFDHAISYNPDYARSYNGLGSLYFRKADLKAYEDYSCTGDWNAAAKAQDYYEKALALPEQHKPKSGHVNLRANVGLGRIYYFLGYCLSPDISPEEWQQVHHYHEQVLAEYQKSPSPYLELEVALAYQDLGDMAFYEAKWRLELDSTDSVAPDRVEQAIFNYQQALEILGPVNNKQKLDVAENVMSRLTYVMCLSGQHEKASQTLSQFRTINALSEATYSKIVHFSQGVCNYE